MFRSLAVFLQKWLRIRYAIGSSAAPGPPMVNGVFFSSYDKHGRDSVRARLLYCILYAKRNIERIPERPVCGGCGSHEWSRVQLQTVCRLLVYKISLIRAVYIMERGKNS